MIVSDNGTELTSNAVLAWCEEIGVRWHYITPASRATGANLEGPGRRAGSSALGLRRDPHGSVKQIRYDELEDGGALKFPQNQASGAPGMAHGSNTAGAQRCSRYQLAWLQSESSYPFST
jgi:hypothetical protein